MTRIIILTVLVTLSWNTSSGQTALLSSKEYPELKYYPLQGQVFFKDYRQVQGSAYLTEDWAEGDIFLSNGEELADVKFKFDTYAHQLLVYNEYVKRVVYLKMDQIDYFTIQNGEGVNLFRKVTSDKSLRMGSNEYLLQVLPEGPVSLYKLYYCEILPLRSPVMPYIDEFVKGQNYYFYSNGEFETAKLRRSFLLRKFPEQKAELKLYIRKQNLRLRNEKDFARAIAYLNTLPNPVTAQ